MKFELTWWIGKLHEIMMKDVHLELEYHVIFEKTFLCDIYFIRKLITHFLNLWRDREIY